MKLSLKETLNKILSRIVYYDRERDYFTGTTNVYSSATGSYTSGTLITLNPNKRYILMGSGQSNTGGAYQYYSTFAITANSGTQKVMASTPSQPYAQSGASHNFHAYVETGNSTLGIGINTYKYSTGYTLYWTIYAIEI